MDISHLNLDRDIKDVVVQSLQVSFWIIPIDRKHIYQLRNDKLVEVTNEAKDSFFRIHPKDFEIARSIFEDIVNLKSQVTECDFRIKRSKDDKEYMFYHLYFMEHRNEQNQVDYIIARIHKKDLITQPQRGKVILGQYNEIFHHNEAIICFNDQGVVTKANIEAKKIIEFGYEKDFFQANILNYDNFTEEDRQHIKNHNSFTLELRFTLKENAVMDIKDPRFATENRFVCLNYHPLYGDNGEFETNVLVLRDFTEDFIMEHLADNYQKQITHIYKKYRLLHVDYYPSNHTFSFYGGANDADVVHMPSEEVMLRVHPKFKDEALSYVYKMNDGITENISFQSLMTNGVDPTYKSVIVSLFPEYNENGMLTNYTGLVRDISKEEYEHRHVLQYQRKTEILNRKYKISLWNYDPEDHIMYSDNIVESDVYHNYTKDELDSMTHPDYKQKLQEYLDKMNQRTENLENLLIFTALADQKYHYLFFVPEVLRDDYGKILRYLFICRDVTEEKEKEFKMKTYIEHVQRMTEECGICLYNYTPGENILRFEDPLPNSSDNIISIKDYIDRAHPDDAASIWNTIDLINEKNQTIQEHNYRWMPNGETAYKRYRSIAMPVKNEKGETIQYGFLRIDITNTYESTEMLRFSQRVGQIGAWTYDLITQSSRWTEESFRIMGIPVTKDMKVNFNDYTHLINDDDRLLYFNKMMKAFAIGENSTFSMHITTPSGEKKIVEQRMIIQKDSNGKPTFAYGTMMDITERARLIDQSKESHQLLHTVIKSLPVMIFIKDIDQEFRFVIVNEKFSSFFKMTPEFIIGKRESDFSDPEIESICRESDKLALKHTLENPLNQIEMFPDGNGGYRYLQSTKFVQNIQGRNLLMCAASDVTELQEAKSKAEESDRLKSSFLANMSHEIRTPLNAIVGFSDLIASNVSPEENSQFQEIIHTNTEHLLRLISDILDISKLESNAIDFVYTDFDLSNMLQELVASIQPYYEKKGILLEKKVPPHPLIVHMDKTRLSEIMNNFLTNALKNTEKGTVTIGYETKQTSFRIFVKDTGCGISEDKTSIIFERFEKLDSFKSGTGLGLAVCKAITQAFKGKIGVDSELGKGSTFWTEFPL